MEGHNDISQFLEGFYSLSPSDQKFLRDLLEDYRLGLVTDQEFSSRLQERKDASKIFLKFKNLKKLDFRGFSFFSVSSVCLVN